MSLSVHVINCTAFVTSMASVTDNARLHCSNGALTGSLGLLVQALLAIVAFGALVSKFALLPMHSRCKVNDLTFLFVYRVH